MEEEDASCLHAESFVTNDDALSLRAENSVLKGELRAYTQRFAPILTVESILRLLDDHYFQHDVGSDHPSLVARYYIVESPTNELHALSAEEEDVIDLLWLGRVDEHPIVVNSRKAILVVHPTKVRDNRPLIVARLDDDGTEWPVVRRNDENGASFMCKLQPTLPGMLLDPECVKLWYRNIDFRKATSNMTVWSGHEVLERLASRWLRRAPRSPPEATLLVDVQEVQAFVGQMYKNPTARCHLWCTGGRRIFVFLCLTCPGTQADVCRLPVGSIEA